MPVPTIRRAIYNVVTDDLASVRDFYATLLDMELIYESDWYVVLVPREGPRMELGIIARDSEATPQPARRPFGGAW